MHRGWIIRAAAGAALLLAIVGALQWEPVRAPARRVKWYIWEQMGWYEPPPPPPPTYEELLERARTQGGAEAQQELLTAHRERILAMLQAELCAPDGGGDEFRTQLLLALGREEARSIIRSMVDGTGCYWSHHTLAAMGELLGQDELREIALTHPSAIRNEAYELVKEKDDAFIEAFLSQPRNQSTHVIEYRVGMEHSRRFYQKLTRDGKLILIHAMANRQFPQSDLLALLAAEEDSGIRQEIRYRTGDMAGVMAEMEEHGAFQGNFFWHLWEVEQQMAAEYPDSLLARGIRAYEEVRGEPYFSESRQMGRGRFPIWELGNQTYDPAREIPGWERFLEEFPRHPAADDAAYRLARSLEIEERYAEAITWLHRTTGLPDGEMAHQARGRIIWILDALLEEEALAALDREELPEEVRPYLDYSLALRHLRAGRYPEAVTALDQLLAAHGDLDVPVAAGMHQPTYRHLLQEQRAQAARLAELAARPDPESQYALAATMFHDEELFRNQLWLIGKGYGGFGGHAEVALRGDMEERYSRWMAESSNYVQAAKAFAQVENAPPEIAAKATYSRALSLAKLLRPGTVIALWKPETAIAAEAVELFEAMAARFPDHELADDALLSLAYLKRDPGYFTRILQEYPDSDTAADARLGTFPILYETSGAVPPYRYLSIEEAPPEVGRWAEAVRASQPYGSLVQEGYTYVLVAAPGPTRIEAHMRIEEPGLLTVSAYVRADPNGPGYLLIRLHDASRTVRVSLSP